MLIYKKLYMSYISLTICTIIIVLTTTNSTYRTTC